MTEPAALTHARNEVMVAAWFQCVSLYIDGDPCTEDYKILKRCPGLRMGAHHHKKRSAGGEHTPENLLPWCHDCHERLEATTKRNGPFTDDAGRDFYTEDIGGRDEVRKVRVYDYMEFADELEGRHIENEQLMALGASYGIKGQHCIGFAMEESDRLGLWMMSDDLNPEDTDFCAYLNNRGMSIAETTLREKINVYASLRRKGIGYQDLLDAVDECSQVHKFPPGYTAIRDNMPKLRLLEAPEILGLLASSPSSDFKASLSDHIEGAKNDAALERGETRVTCSATLTVELEHTFTSLGSVEADRAKFEGRIRSAIGVRGIPGSFRFKHHGEPVVLRAEES